VIEAGATAAQTRYWLDDGPPIRYAPSASVLYAIEQRPSTRPVGSTAASVLSLSDPVYDPAEVSRAAPAAQQSAGALRDSAGGLTRNGYVRAGGSLERLPGTAAETDAIRAAFAAAPSAGAVEVLQRFDATEPKLRAGMTDKRYLHLATHGLVDEGRGALFAALATTPPPTEAAQPENDGFLQLHEIYQLRLSTVDLAVLSACETNVGDGASGEGPFALSRGFLAAGARRVVASQWAVEDRSTAELVGRLFQGIAAAEQKAERLDFARVLRDAKRAVRSRPGWENPYFWAPFVLTGAR